MILFLKGSFFEKLKEVKIDVELNSILIATNFTSICCLLPLYRVKDKNESYRRSTRYSIGWMVINTYNTNYSIGGMVINTQDTNYSIGGMVINTLDTNYSIGGMVINTLDTNYSIGGMVINTQDTNYFI